MIVHGYTSKIRHPNVVPDQYDSNFFCSSCEKKFRKKAYYHNHLRVIHKMELHQEDTAAAATEDQVINVKMEEDEVYQRKPSINNSVPQHEDHNTNANYTQDKKIYIRQKV
jgi:hypothetical protein